MLSGATGQFYGNKYTWQFLDGWPSHLNTVGSRQMTFVTNLFSHRRWFDLVPDTGHRLVVSGYGTYSDTALMSTTTTTSPRLALRTVGWPWPICRPVTRSKST